jgi:hypothetical protein
MAVYTAARAIDWWIVTISAWLLANNQDRTKVNAEKQVYAGSGG